MKTFTDEEINALAKSGKISQKDYMKLLLTAKEKVAEPVETPSDAVVLAEIRDVLSQIAAKIESPKEPLPCAAPQVTVNAPTWDTLTATVTERDKNGAIKKVSFKREGETWDVGLSK